MTDVILAELVGRLQATEARTLSLQDTVRDLLPRRRSAETVAPGETPAVHKWPVRVPAPAPVSAPPPAEILPDPFLLYDVIAALPLAVVAVDGDGRVRLWNPAAVELFGWPHVDVVGGPPPFLPSDRHLEHQRLLATARTGAAGRDLATVRRTRTGAEIAVTATAAADAGGGVVFTFRPRPKDAARPAVRPAPRPPATPAPARHARKLETLGRLLTAVAHDVNNVLAVVSGHAELLAARVPDESPMRESLDVIRSAADHAVGLTRQLLTFARPGDAAPTPVDVNHLLAGLAPLVRGLAGAGVAVTIRTPRDAGVVLADPAQIELILVNLVANAKDAMPDGGRIGVRTGLEIVDPARRGWPPGIRPGAYSRVTVADTGTGIDDVTRARMFDPFFTTKGAAGSGVGLATVRDVVNRLGGHVECDSDPGTGTVFRVYFPAVPDAAPADEPAGPPTVLLADDDPTCRAAAKFALEQAGFDVIETAAADDAVRLARVTRSPIHALVTDVVMPGGGGRRLAEKVRAARPGLPVVFISGYPQAPFPLDAASAFVRKPFRGEELLLGLRKVLRGVTA